MTFTADAVEHSEVNESGNELQFVTPRQYAIYIRDADINKAVQQIAGRPYRIKLTTTDSPAPAAPAPLKAKTQDDEVARRALDDPEVQRFREVFGGEVRNIRNLKE